MSPERALSHVCPGGNWTIMERSVKTAPGIG